MTRLTATRDLPTPDGRLDNTAHQQIITAFQTGDGGAMRAKAVCHALGLGTEPTLTIPAAAAEHTTTSDSSPGQT